MPSPTPTADPQAFQIQGFDAATNSSQAFLIWYTPSNPSTSQVYWGTSPQLGHMSMVDTNKVTNHAVTINGLTPATVYYFQAVSVDGSGHMSVSNMIMKTTKP